MSTKRDRVRARSRAKWETILRGLLEQVRQDIGLSSNEKIPDAVLLAEVNALFPTALGRGHEMDYRYAPRKQWFGFRLIGFGETHDERIDLAARLRDVGSSLSPIGLGPSRRASRRSPAAGRRRNKRRRERLLKSS